VQPKWCCQSRPTPQSIRFLEKLTLAQLVIPCLLWNSKDHYHVYNGSPQDPILGQLNPFYILTLYFLRLILLSSSHLWVVISYGLFQCFLTKIMLSFVASHMLPKCLTHLILLNLIYIIFSESTNYKFPNYVIFSIPLLVPLLKTKLSTLSIWFSPILCFYSSFRVRDK
jgi:hypothetical protein